MTKIEIINETVEFYESDPSRRAVQDETCKYLTDNGNMCALGRCFTDEAIEKCGNYQGCISLLISDYKLSKDGFQLLLKPEYRGHELAFWQGIQSLHDDEYNWNEDGISESGQRCVNLLFQRWTGK